jgi:hypothetical protein
MLLDELKEATKPPIRSDGDSESGSNVRLGPEHRDPDATYASPWSANIVYVYAHDLVVHKSDNHKLWTRN